MWTDVTSTSTAFLSLKEALTTAPVLHLPDFSKDFVVDCDASAAGFGAVLHQGAGPIAFFSHQFAPRHMKIAAYERELIGLVQAVHHWRPYLWGWAFVVPTDHYALKFMLDQRLSTIPQHNWIRKLFDTVELRDLREAISRGKRHAPWQVTDGLIRHAGKVFLPAASPLLQTVLHLAHSAGHEGYQKTLQRLHADFYIECDRHLVREYVRACATCQCNKTEALQPAGLLLPLPVPSRIWADISMDFVEALPKVHGNSVILTVVDRMSKYAHFTPLGHPFITSSIARAFFHDIVRLHGFPESIVSD
jgi:hypothetical protein